ncbi:AIPR family protein [bacterium]|nr:AIPR family protein [bacterium]
MGNVTQSIVEDRVEEIAENYSIKTDKAFERFCFSVTTGERVSSLKDTDIVDGGQDKQIDLIYLEETDDEATCFIIQSKLSSSFSSNTLIQMKNGLEWIFAKPKKELQTLSNINFKDKISEFRSIRGDKGPSNINIKLYYITNAENAENLPHEVVQEKNSIINTYNNGAFKSFSFNLLGAKEIVQILNYYERKDKKICCDIKFKYDINNPSLIRYFDEGVSAVICTANATEIAKIVCNDTEGVIFDLNIRRFLGNRGNVNSAIEKSCSTPTSSNEFWFLNNGITIVCDKFDPVTDPDNPLIKIENMQIVNGCQTASTLALMHKESKLQGDTKVLLRIYQTSDNALVESIVKATNNQNKITDRDLRSNDSQQIELEKAFRPFDLFYERKKRQYEKDKTIDRKNIIENEIVGKSFLAIRLLKPSDARSRKYRIWGDLYDRIFSNDSILEYVYCIKIFKAVDHWLTQSKYYSSKVDNERMIAKNCSFHVARITSFYLRQSDSWAKADEQLKEKIKEMTNKNFDLEQKVEAAFQKLKAIIEVNPTFNSDPIKAFKSVQLDTEITKVLREVTFDSPP